ncbi:MAG: DUF885 domain-containing protein [Bacteroidetes bacterium]|nr:DUF885 domain-containing protein [Bacteroidota bacterium]
MKSLYIFLALVLIFFSTGFQSLPSVSDANSDFETLSDNFVNEYLEINPESAVGLGLHQYDGKTSDYSLQGFIKQIDWLKNYKSKLELINPFSLNQKNYFNYRLLSNEVNKQLFGLEDREFFRKNPMTYAGAVDVNIYISRDFAPIEERVKSIIKIEKNAPNVFAAARQNLKPVLPKPYVELAISIAKGSADFLGSDLKVALKDVKNEALMKEFNDANDRAIKELKDYADYLEKEKLPKADNNYAIGKELYQKMLAGEMVSYTPEQILEIGLKKLKEEQQKFEEVAKKIDPTKKAIDVFKEIQVEHPTAENLIPDTKKNLDAIRQYLIDKKIISMPSDVKALVKETPQYARATSFASMDTPGPFEKSTQAYYYVTPVESNWSDKQKDEWLTAFNYYTTDVVSIHEAYPGHYVQFLHLNASDATKLQKIFGSYAFTEGWAHYTEQMMIEEGFGKDKGDMAALKYHLAQLDESLLRYCRLCVSIKMHTQGMTVDEGTQFFMDNCYYEKQPSRSEAMRGTNDPGYLNYTLGKLMIYKLRDDYARQEGSNYSLMKFHDEMLKYGMPPIPLLREIMLKDKSIWNDIL